MKLSNLEFDPVNFIYILLFFIAVHIFREGYFRDFFRTFKNEIIKQKKKILFFIILVALTILFFDKGITMYFLTHHSDNGVLIEIAQFGSFLGDGKYILSIVVTFGMIFLLIGREKLTNLVYISLSSSLVIAVINPFLKSIFYRQRPYETYNPYLIFAFKRAKEEGRLFTNMYDSSYYSMPSGHTITVAAIFVVFALHAKNKIVKMIFLFLPLITAFGRVYECKHWVSDTMVGYGIGALVATVMYTINKKRV